MYCERNVFTRIVCKFLSNVRGLMKWYNRREASESLEHCNYTLHMPHGRKRVKS